MLPKVCQYTFVFLIHINFKSFVHVLNVYPRCAHVKGREPTDTSVAATAGPSRIFTPPQPSSSTSAVRFKSGQKIFPINLFLLLIISNCSPFLFAVFSSSFIQATLPFSSFGFSTFLHFLKMSSTLSSRSSLCGIIYNFGWVWHLVRFPD